MCSFALLHPWFPPSKAPLKIGRSWVQFLLMTEWKNQIFSEDFNFFDISPRASDREQNVFYLALLHPWFPPSKAPLKIGRSWVQFLLMTEWKNPIFSEDFNFFDISPRAKCVLFALLHPWFTLSKAPLKIGRSWVQFLLMTEWKNPIFSEDFNFFDIWPRAKCVLFALLHPWFTLSKAPLKIGRSWEDKIKFSEDFNFFPIWPRAKICSFKSLISPLESTLEDWEVMNEKIQFSPKISTFSISDRELNVFSCSFTSLISPV